MDIQQVQKLKLNFHSTSIEHSTSCRDVTFAFSATLTLKNVQYMKKKH